MKIKKYEKKLFLLILLLPILLPSVAQSNWEVRVMPQMVFGTRNTVQRPNNTEGTRVYLNSEFERKNSVGFSPRFEVEYKWKRNRFIATAALLNDKFEGVSPKDILYDGVQFNNGDFINTDYKFNTYRIGYRYRLVDKNTFAFELGATLLLRDAYISFEDSGKKAKFSNVGVAPLLSYYLEWKATSRLSLLTYGDAFAIKAGRAEDIFAGVKCQFHPMISATAGYRLLEGGSDSDKVYTMSTFHFISLGVGFNF